MARNIITALDVGTSTVQTVVAEKRKGEEGLRILGVGIAPSRGIRRGVVFDLGDAMASIRESAADIARNREIVNAVPERGGLDEEDFEHGVAPMRRSDSG